jgi:hypothetical protein
MAYMKQAKSEAKKRIMFIQKEDYNFLTYNLLLVLYVLKCESQESMFKDFRKIAYLIEIISTQRQIDSYTTNELSIIYTRAQLKKKLISHLLIVLKNRKFIGVALNKPQRSFDLWLITENIPTEFLSNSLFSIETENIQQIRRNNSYLRTMTIKNFVDNLFTKKGVVTWEI